MNMTDQELDINEKHQLVGWTCVAIKLEDSELSNEAIEPARNAFIELVRNNNAYFEDLREVIGTLDIDPDDLPPQLTAKLL